MFTLENYKNPRISAAIDCLYAQVFVLTACEQGKQIAFAVDVARKAVAELEELDAELNRIDMPGVGQTVPSVKQEG